MRNLFKMLPNSFLTKKKNKKDSIFLFSIKLWISCLNYSILICILPYKNPINQTINSPYYKLQSKS